MNILYLIGKEISGELLVRSSYKSKRPLRAQWHWHPHPVNWIALNIAWWRSEVKKIRKIWMSPTYRYVNKFQQNGGPANPLSFAPLILPPVLHSFSPWQEKSVVNFLQNFLPCCYADSAEEQEVTISVYLSSGYALWNTIGKNPNSAYWFGFFEETYFICEQLFN